MPQDNSILSSHLDDSNFFPPVTNTFGGEDNESSSGSLLLGQTIGKFKLVKVLGEGGFGIVYLAEQNRPIRREVALKIIKPGMDTKLIIARFEAERQALAMLDHPNIAQVFTAGSTPMGRPYFVMEYVKGLPITEHCDKKRLTIKQRLDLFVRVCNAVQHAHQKGIIHRDLKPTNILVTKSEDEIIPKIIDFGIAKATSQKLTDRTLYTEQGQFVGTPAYMSPEQADMSQGQIDTRSDIYSLGVILYELLVGALPLDVTALRDRGSQEILRYIQNTNPQTPSTKVARLGNRAQPIAATRQIEVNHLRHLLKQELEWIPLMAMRKEASRRYQSVADLADDVKRYLKGDPLKAGPESKAYYIKKFMQKHAILLGGTATFLSLLVISLIVSLVLYHQAKQAQGVAVQKRMEVEAEKELTQKLLYFNNISLAAAELQNENAINAKAILRDCDPNMRDWEHQYLSRIANQSTATLNDPDGSIRRVLFSPDENYVISGSDKGKIRIWDISTETVIRTINAHESAIFCLRLNPDGTRLASSSGDHKVRIWDVESGKLLSDLTGHTSDVNGVDFSPDGKYLASCSRDATIRIWDLSSAKELNRLSLHGKPIGTIAYSPCGLKLAFCNTKDNTGENYICVWDIQKQTKLVERLFTEYNTRGVKQFHNIEFDHESGEIITSNWGQVWGWDASTLEIKSAIPQAHRYGSFIARLSPDGRHVITGSMIGNLKLWDRHKGILLRNMHGHDGPISDISYSRSGNKVVTSSYSGEIRLWNATSNFETFVIVRAHASKLLRSAEFSSDGTLLITGGDDKNVWIWETRSWKPLFGLHEHKGPVTSAKISPDGQYLISASHDPNICIWDLRSLPPTLLHKYRGHADAINDLSFSPDGKQFVSASSDTTINMWDTASGQLIKTLTGHAGEVQAVHYTNSGEMIISGSTDQTVRMWIAKDGTCSRILHGHEAQVNAVAIRPDDRMIISGDSHGRIMWWTEENRDQFMLLGNHVKSISDLLFVNSQRILASSLDGTIRLWDADTKECILDVLASDVSGPIRSLAFSPDKQTIAAAAQWGGWLYIINSPDSAMVAQREHHQKRIEQKQILGNRALATNPAVIPKQAQRFNQHSYLVYMDKLSWYDAKAYCQKVGGHLICIESLEEQKWVEATFPQYRGFWIGAYFDTDKNCWHWVNHAPWQFTNFYEMEINNRPKEGGQIMMMHHTGKWDIVDGNTRKKRFIIEWDR